MSKGFQELRPIIIVNLSNMSDWDQLANDFLVRLGLLDFVSEDEQVRKRAEATAVDPSVPPPGAPANWISIEVFQQLLHARFQGPQAANVAKRAFVDGHLDKLFTAAVQRSQEVRNNVMSLLASHQLHSHVHSCCL